MDLSTLKGVDSLGSARVKLPAMAVAGGKVSMVGGSSVTFCEIWPAAKAALEILGKKVPALAFVVGILISVGDSVCPS